jgi:hypothetical protein
LPARDVTLFDALGRLSDTMRLRWSKDGDWLRFRSTGFFHDRLKEVPNRLLARWAESRRIHKTLRLDDLLEIAQLPDTQLQSQHMAEGARSLFGLVEWDLVRSGNLLHHWRYLAALSPAQRRAALSEEGVSFARLSLPQQQTFVALNLGRQAEHVQLEHFARATLQVEFKQPDPKVESATTAASQSRNPGARPADPPDVVIFRYTYGDPDAPGGRIQRTRKLFSDSTRSLP